MAKSTETTAPVADVTPVVAAPVADESASFEVTLRLPNRIRLFDHDGAPVYWDLKATADKVGSKLFEVGGRTILTNVYNGGGAKASPAEKHAAVLKKMDSWAKGEFNIVERGESAYSGYRDVFVADCIAAGMTGKQADEAIRAKVTERLGKDTKATFANFIEASAIEYMEASKDTDAPMTRDEARESLEAYYAAESDRRAKELEKAGKKVEVPTIDLSKFRKPAPTA